MSRRPVPLPADYVDARTGEMVGAVGVPARHHVRPWFPPRTEKGPRSVPADVVPIRGDREPLPGPAPATRWAWLNDDGTWQDVDFASALAVMTREQGSAWLRELRASAKLGTIGRMRHRPHLGRSLLCVEVVGQPWRISEAGIWWAILRTGGWRPGE